MTTSTAVLFVFAAAALGACSQDHTPVAQGREQSQDVVTALCDAQDEIGRDLGATKAIFLDRAHGALHDLASDAAEIDRSVAARLLEAKQTLEADLEETPSRRVLAKDFDALIDSTRRALEATSVAAPKCRQGTGR